jgi:hypothetical protein
MNANLKSAFEIDPYQRAESFLGDNASSLTEVVMPIDSMLVSAAVILMFLMFAGVLMWGEVHGRSERRRLVPPPERRGKKVSENYIALRP